MAAKNLQIAVYNKTSINFLPTPALMGLIRLNETSALLCFWFDFCWQFSFFIFYCPTLSVRQTINNIVTYSHVSHNIIRTRPPQNPGGDPGGRNNTSCTPVPHPPLTSNHNQSHAPGDSRHLDMLFLLPNLLEMDQQRLAHGVAPSDWLTEGCLAKRGLASGNKT